MKLRIRKIDAIIMAVLIVISGLFLSKAGYINPFSPQTPPPEGENETTPPVEQLLPPTSFIPAYRRDVSPDDEGVHFDTIRISREWWYYNAIFNDEKSELHEWSVAISFNHMARGDLLGTLKPDLLTVTLFGNQSETFGGMINKPHYLGILKEGTLIAHTPGVSLQFENSWAEGRYPNWHVHGETSDIETGQDVVIDLDFTALSGPIWTIGSRAFDKSESELANYLFAGCEVSGNVTINGNIYSVKGTGNHEHAWNPKIITRGSINGWDWFSFALDNGAIIYASNFIPTPQILFGKLSKLDPFGTFLISTDNGKTFTELKDATFKITSEDKRIFPFVKMPAAFTISASPSINPLYMVSQSLLYGTQTRLSADIQVTHEINKIWKFPSYVGMKIGYCTIDGTLSWSDDDGSHELPVHGVGVSWSMRAFL